MSVFSSILSTPATLLVREFNHTNMHSALHTVGSTSPQSTRGERKETRVYQALLFFILKPRARATIKGKKNIIKIQSTMTSHGRDTDRHRLDPAQLTPRVAATSDVPLADV